MALLAVVPGLLRMGQGTAFAIAETLEQSSFIAGMVLAGGVLAVLALVAVAGLVVALLLASGGDDDVKFVLGKTQAVVYEDLPAGVFSGRAIPLEAGLLGELLTVIDDTERAIDQMLDHEIYFRYTDQEG